MGTTLKSVLADSVKNAMRAKDSVRLGTLRFLQAAVTQQELDSQTQLNDDQIIAIIEKQVKQRRESIAAFEKAGRTESAQKEQAELEILHEFLPEQASAEEISAAIDEAIKTVGEQGHSGAPAMGKVMAILKPALSGKADMSVVAAQVKARINP